MLYPEFSIKNILLSAFLLVGCAHAVAAEEIYYVSDQLVITLRAGQGDEFRIIKTLRSGTPVEVLEEGEAFAHIRVADGTEGWVRKQYLQDKPTAQVSLDQLSARFKRTQAENRQLGQQLNALKNKHAALDKEHKRLVKDSKALRKENIHLNQLAQQPLRLEKENQSLKAESVRIKQENERLRSENAGHRESTAQTWFMYGAAVLLLGILAGLLLPKIRSRRSSAWS